MEKFTHILQIPIKNQLDKWRRKETTDRRISPLGLLCLQGEETKKETKIDAKNIEEEIQFHGLQASKSPPEIGEIWDHQKLQQRNRK